MTLNLFLYNLLVIEAHLSVNFHSLFHEKAKAKFGHRGRPSASTSIEHLVLQSSLSSQTSAVIVFFLPRAKGFTFNGLIDQGQDRHAGWAPLKCSIIIICYISLPRSSSARLHFSTMLLPKGGVTWKSARARLPPYRAVFQFLNRSRTVTLVALVVIVVILWGGLRSSSQEMQRYILVAPELWYEPNLLTPYRYCDSIAGGRRNHRSPCR